MHYKLLSGDKFFVYITVTESVKSIYGMHDHFVNLVAFTCVNTLVCRHHHKMCCDGCLWYS